MIKISKPDKYRRCGSCLSENKVRKISYYTHENSQTTIMLCSECLVDLFFKAWKFEIEDKED